MSKLDVCSRRGAVQIHVYFTYKSAGCVIRVGSQSDFVKSVFAQTQIGTK